MSSTIKVLCVDDNGEQARCACLLLEKAGCDVRMCEDGATALQIADSFQPDVCVIDLSMPEMNGDELSHRLRDRAGSRPMRCIALTGLWDINAQHRTHNAGFEEHLVKPIEPEQLIQAVMGHVPAGVS